MTSKIIDILLVEDNPADVELTQLAIEQSKLLCNLNVVNDGKSAMDYLLKKEPYVNAIRPDIVILDLNLPMKNGREVLKEIKEDEELKLIPVVVLTQSSADEDVIKAYTYGANAYITKPLDFSQFVKMVHSIEDFWFAIVKLPPKKSL